MCVQMQSRQSGARPRHVSTLSSCISMSPDSAAFNDSHHRLYISDVNVGSLCILASGTIQDLKKHALIYFLKNALDVGSDKNIYFYILTRGHY